MQNRVVYDWLRLLRWLSRQVIVGSSYLYQNIADYKMTLKSCSNDLRECRRRKSRRSHKRGSSRQVGSGRSPRSQRGEAR